MNSKNKKLVASLSSTLEEKIEAIRCKTVEIDHSYIDVEMLSISLQHNLGHGIEVIKAIKDSNDRALKQLSEYCYQSKQLMMIKKKLNCDNATIVESLLKEDKYRSLSDREIKEQLRVLQSV